MKLLKPNTNLLERSKKVFFSLFLLSLNINVRSKYLIKYSNTSLLNTNKC